MGRWHSLDPLAEKYFGSTAYAYVANNPLSFIDPNGMETVYHTTDQNQIRALLNSLKNGGSLNNANLSDWNQSEITKSKEFGVYIGGTNSFKNKVEFGLTLINKTQLGALALSEVRKGNPLIILPRSEQEENKMGYENNIVYFGSQTISESTFGAIGDAGLSGVDFINLGHEIWHAYTDRTSNGKYSTYTRWAIEKKAVGFENYLASVYGINHVRKRYKDLERLFAKRLLSAHFNPFGEHIRYVREYESNEFGYATGINEGWQLAPVKTPVEVIRSFNFMILPSKD